MRPTNVMLETGLTSDVLLRGSVVTYAYPDGASEHRGDYTYRFDNFSTRAIPEPATVLLLILAATSIPMRGRQIQGKCQELEARESRQQPTV